MKKRQLSTTNEQENLVLLKFTLWKVIKLCITLDEILK